MPISLSAEHLTRKTVALFRTAGWVFDRNARAQARNGSNAKHAPRPSEADAAFLRRYATRDEPPRFGW